MMQRILEAAGYEAMISNSPTHAIDLFAAEPQGFDALVTDYYMPVMTGAELIVKLRELRPELPVVMVTAYAGDTALSSIEALGGVITLGKPVRRPALLAALQDVLAQVPPGR